MWRRKQQRGAGQCESRADDGQRADDAGHPVPVAGGEAVADEGQRSLRDALSHGKGQQVELFCNDHSGHGLVGVGGDDAVQGSVGYSAHQRDAERRAAPGLFPISGTETAGDQTGAAHAEEVGKGGEQHEQRHGDVAASI